VRVWSTWTRACYGYSLEGRRQDRSPENSDVETDVSRPRLAAK
jgi:hypothetical protein